VELVRFVMGRSTCGTSEICYGVIAVHLSNQASATKVIHNSMMDLDKTSAYEAIRTAVNLSSSGDEKEVC
jgi:hypothetical protein